MPLQGEYTPLLNTQMVQVGISHYAQHTLCSLQLQQKDGVRGRAGTLLRYVASGIFSPKASTWEPIVLLLNERDKDIRNDLTAQWRDNKLQELNFVGVVVPMP